MTSRESFQFTGQDELTSALEPFADHHSPTCCLKNGLADFLLNDAVRQVGSQPKAALLTMKLVKVAHYRLGTGNCTLCAGDEMVSD